MAEFKLGRIRFVWKGPWTGATTYYVDDVVRYGGKTFICVDGHTSDADFNVDLNYNPTKWNQMSDGHEWKGPWQTNTFYKINDVVKYGGLLYIANTAHTSALTDALGLEANQAHWTLYAEGLEWKGNWATNTRYKLNDQVRYGGYTYVCNTGHTSAVTTANGLEADQGKWDSFNEGLQYKGAWTTATRYKLNDVVKYGSSVYICTTPHTSDASTFLTDTANWAVMVEGAEFETTDWSDASVTYQLGDIVRYGGNQYVCVQSHVSDSTSPAAGGANWTVMSYGLRYQNDWANNVSYKPGEVVSVNGLTYLAKQDSPTTTITVTASSSVNNRLTYSGSTVIADGMSIRFTGTTFGGIMSGAKYYVKQVISPTELTITTEFGGAVKTLTTASGSMTGTSSFEPPHATYWTALTHGMKWAGEWMDDTEYEIGDIIRFGSNAYVCVGGHRSEADDGSSIGPLGGGTANSRPDQDATGDYWNVLAIGNETEVLTTRGDMVYYGGAGPTRLPVGIEGQVLVSDGTDPVWTSLGHVNHVYYVSPLGKDGHYPVNGGTIDRPWKTIRHACQEIERGCRNPNAAKLLEMNRVFIQREVTEWIQYQIANAPAGGDWENFVYDDFKCERDTGFIVDRVIWDLTHGGNLKMRAAAQTYLNQLANGPYSTEEFGTGEYTKLSEQGAHDVLAFNYMLEVVASVLANEAPATVYQTVNGDNSTATVDQWINTEYQAENVMAEITSLVGIVTTALTDGTIPARYVPNATLYVKSGTYHETLPIIVPAEVALVGDETRSVHIAPADSLVDISDAYYSSANLDRLAEVVSDVVQGNAVTPTTGNTEAQHIEWPFGGADQAAVGTKLARTMKYDMDNRLNLTHSFDYPNPPGYNFSYMAGYGDARELLMKNRTFFKHEVKQYIDNNYPLLKYSRTKCLRDVGHITDAIMYDLTYGGNAQSVVAGLAYYEGVGSDLYIDSTEKLATIASYEYLRSMMEDVVANTPIVPLQTDVVQYTDGNLDGSNAVSFIGANINEMIDIVDNGPGAVTLTDPSTTWVASALTTDNSAMNAIVGQLQIDTIDYINTNFGDFTYNSALCRRDSHYMVQAGYWDAAFGSNFWGVQNGLAYHRPQADKVTSEQRAQELGSVLHIKGEVATSLTGNATAISRARATYDEIVDIISHGVSNADALVFTDTGTANFTNARTQLQTNRQFIIDEMSAWMNTNHNAVWVGLGTEGQNLCKRDVGYTVDALSYDVNYGGNMATRNAARALFSAITGLSVYPDAAMKTAAAAMYTQLGSVCSDVVQELYAGQDTSGTAASATEGARMVTLAGNINAVIVADTISGLVAESTPSITWVDAGIQTVLGTLATDEDAIVASTLQYITDNFSSLKYNHAKCSRDIATIVKAVGYDMMFNSNFQTLKSGYAYLRSSANEVFSLGQKTVTRRALDFVRDAVLAECSDSTAIARVTNLMLTLDDVIYSGSTEGQVCQTEDRNVDWAILQLERNRDFIVEEVRAWMEYNFVDFDTYYDSVTCSRDVGMIIDAVSNDLITGSNFPSSVAGMAYYRANASVVTSGQMMQTVDVMHQVRDAGLRVVTDPTLYTAVEASFDNIINILENGMSAVPAYTFPDNGTSTAYDSTTAADFQTNRATYISNLTSWITTTYPALTYDTAKCERDVGYIVDAATFDILYGGNYQSVIAGDAYYSFGTLQLGASEKTETIAAYGQLKSYLVADADPSSQAAVGSNMDDVIAIVTNGAGTVATTMPVATGETAAIQATYSAMQSAKATVQSNMTQYITDTYSSYVYNQAFCLRDVGYMIDAMKWDMRYGSNYESLKATQLYANAVLGNKEENMFLLRNGTGLRNLTLEGLSGDVTPENEYGTSRVTAGAYASLDPGWGPDDFRTWIIHRSPYVQNVCTFGHAAVGQKIDGSLHAGGYDSIVSNDFTQLISDGIGAWVTNNGRAELVSVFTYYSYIGYLAENGGKIRGTNGNNSYGHFGSVAEGFDSTEVPGTGLVDNHNFAAVVGATFTDSAQEIFHAEFDNAGNEYTEATWIVSGAGAYGAAEQDEFRDDAVFEVRLLDNVDDSTNAPEADGNFGGFGYITNSNTAQGGTSTQITIAATDGEISSAYPGMKLYLDGGTGAGQFGIIDTYNSGTKVATIIKETTGAPGWDHVIPGTPIVSPDASTTYTIEPRAEFTAPGFASTATTVPSGTYVSAIYGDTALAYADVEGVTNGGGELATFLVYRNGSKYDVEIINAGSGYQINDSIVISGADVGGVDAVNDITIKVLSVNSATGAITVIDFTGYGPGGRYVAIQAGSAAGATSEDGITWTAQASLMPTTDTWSDLAWGSFEDGSTFGETNRFVAVASGNDVAAYSETGTAFNVSTMPITAAWCSVTFGEGKFLAIASDSTTVAISYDGEVWDVTGTLNSTGFTSVTYGQGVFVAIKSGATTASYSTDGITWTDSTAGLPASSNWSSIAYGNNRFVAVSATSGTAAAYSVDMGETWYSSTLPATATWNRVVYGQGVFMAVTGSTQAASSEDGVVWTSRTLSTSASGYDAIAFGNPNHYGLFAGIQDGAGTVATYIRTGATTRARVYVSQNKIYSIKLIEPGSGYASTPTMTITDPNNIYEAPFTVRTGWGVLGNPSWKNRGTGYVSAGMDIDTGDGYANFYQNGSYISVKDMSKFPVPGSNVVFGHLPNTTYKLVNVLTQLGSEPGSYRAFFQVAPDMTVYSSPEHEVSVTTRIRYSQVRLTGHDFLDVGTGNFDQANYPEGPPEIEPNQYNETVNTNGGRVFYTSTDQDGNFRVGELFTIEQSTGVATLNADAFNIAGLSELTLGEVSLGGGSAAINEFSTDPFFTANSDNIVPTQRAIKAYIASQIGGGGASLNVNSVTAGFIYIAGQQITTTTGGTIQMKATLDFQGGVTGYPMAWNFYFN